MGYRDRNLSRRTGEQSFKGYVSSSIVTHNLLVIARHELA